MNTTCTPVALTVSSTEFAVPVPRPVGSVGVVVVVVPGSVLEVDVLPFVVHQLVMVAEGELRLDSVLELVMGGGVYELHQPGAPVVPDGLLEVVVVVEVVVFAGPMPPVPPDVVVVPVVPLPVPDWSHPAPVPV